MKTITKYKALDGAEFTDPVECEKYEAFARRCEAVIKHLKPLPKDKDLRFANGHGFIQQDPMSVAAVRRDLLELAKEVTTHKWIQQSIDDPTAHHSWAGRIISEVSEPLWKAWYRIGCIDKQGREWGQQYYADHPDQAEQFEITRPASPEGKEL